MSAEHSREVAASEAGERLDRWLVSHFGGVGRRGASELIAQGGRLALCCALEPMLGGDCLPFVHALGSQVILISAA